ncbi:MAG: hypothetical protein WAN48_12870 [Actinomycetes bacterium]
MTSLTLAVGESDALVDYLDRLTRLDARAAVRLQAAGAVLGVWSGPPFDVVALRPIGLEEPQDLDLTVSAQRLHDRVVDAQEGLANLAASEVELPATVPGPSWVGLLPPRAGWEERARGDVGYVRAAVDQAKLFFGQRTEGVTDRVTLDSVAQDVWERACLGEVPVRAAHAAEILGLLGPADGPAVAYASGSWLRLAAPGGSVAVRRDPPSNLLFSLMTVAGG